PGRHPLPLRPGRARRHGRSRRPVRRPSPAAAALPRGLTPGAAAKATARYPGVGVDQDRRMAMPTMRAAEVKTAKGPLEVVERAVPEPGPGQVRIKVQASGICHSDALTKEGY